MPCPWLDSYLFWIGTKKAKFSRKVNSRPKCFGPIYVQSIRSLLNLITNMRWFLKILGSKDNSRTQYNQVCPKCLNNVYIYFCRRMFIMYDPISTSVKSPRTIQGYTLAWDYKWLWTSFKCIKIKSWISMVCFLLHLPVSLNSVGRGNPFLNLPVAGLGLYSRTSVESAVFEAWVPPRTHKSPSGVKTELP